MLIFIWGVLGYKRVGDGVKMRVKVSLNFEFIDLLTLK